MDRETNCRKNLANSSKNLKRKANCNKNMDRETNCSKNIDRESNYSKGKVVETKCKVTEFS